MAITSIPLTGLAANDPVPGVYIETIFGAGPASGGTTDFPILLIANRLSSGDAGDDGYVYGPDTAVPLTGQADANLRFGQGSEAARMYNKVLKVNPTSAVYVICPKESTGSQATGTITITGNATASSSLRVFVLDESVDSSVVAGDTPTAQAANLVIAINSKPDWPLVASASGGIVTLTARQKGPRGNFLRFAVRYMSASGSSVSPAGLSQTLSGGTTADDNTAALATISGMSFYYIVSAAEDATQLGNLVAQVGLLAAPVTGIRQRAFGASVDTLSNAQTVAIGLNSARAELGWAQNCDLPPSELAASLAAVYALFEAPAVPRCNYSGFGNDAQTSAFWLVKANRSGTVPTRNQLVSALKNGLTPIKPEKGGRTSIVKRVTTRSLNGSVQDFRIRDAHKVTVVDRYVADLGSKFVQNFSGKLIGNDPAKGQRVPGSNVVTPRVLTAAIDGQTVEYGNNDLIENVQQTIDQTIVIRETSPTTRLSCKIPLDVIDILDIVAVELDQVG